jgi:hypothetical protein
MATERELELLDNYLGNRMGSQERSAFERALESDPTLKKEFDFQQQLINGIRRERALELKKSLSEIAVPASAGGTWATKASLVVIAGAVALSVYFGLRKSEPENTTVTNSQQQTQSSDQPKEQPVLTQPQAPASETTDNAVVNKEIVKPSGKEQVTETTASVTHPKPDVFDPSQELENEASESTPRIEENTNTETSSGTVSSSSIIVETDNSNKKLNFHYQFKDGKLFLYGSFEKNLYEILEFFSNNKRTVFLFYNSNYYLLNEKQTKPAALKPIADPVLLKKLTEYREGN